MSINVEYINPFVEGATNIIKNTCNVDVALGKPYLKASPFASNTVAIILGVTGDIKGQVIFNMPIESAKAIASKMMMGMPVTELDEMSKSAISELTNMILGTTATIFYNKGIKIDITPPSLLLGESMQITTNKIENVSIPLEITEIGAKFEIDMALAENVE